MGNSFFLQKATARRLLLLFIFFACNLSGSFAQTNVEIFGQNRVQYRKFEWKYFDTEHFRIFHYDRNGTILGKYVAEQAEKDLDIIERRLGSKFADRFNIIVYNNYDEYRQTNIGRKYDSQLQNVPAGTLNIYGDKLVVYFTGVHTDLRRQLRTGISKVVLEKALEGESIGQQVKSGVNPDLPPWVLDGYLAYLVDGWDAVSQSKWRGLLQANPDMGFYRLSEKDPELAGKAFWKFISASYGEFTIRKVLAKIQDTKKERTLIRA